MSSDLTFSLLKSFVSLIEVLEDTLIEILFKNWEPSHMFLQNMASIKNEKLPEIIVSQSIDCKFTLIYSAASNVNNKQRLDTKCLIGSKVALGMLSIASLLIAAIM